jgi:hypothetical protein
MNLSKLLATRQALLRQTQLANLAYAYATLHRFAVRIAGARLRGLVKLRPADASDECFWASLTALEGNQSVIEEHFADRDLLELAEAMTFAAQGEFKELDFRLEDLEEQFAAPLRQSLESAGVTLDTTAESADVPDVGAQG